MSGLKFLFEEEEGLAFRMRLTRPSIPSYITDNLRFLLFNWQEDALVRFLTHEQIRIENNETTANHLLFNMATGTGKTLLMAALILYYYKQGYRHFVFFVNQNNIVGKTEENLVNPAHHKYLFRQNIVIDNKTIKIKKIETFSDKTEDIQVLFTSIHKLHNTVYAIKENSVYLEDLQKKNIIMLADEAHHLNADTKKKKGQQEELPLITELSERAGEIEVEKSWEDTVINKLLYKGKLSIARDNKNALIEFTATVPRDKAVEEKYRDKIITQFDLKDFLKAGYTKEINLVSSSFDKKKRILQALLFNWYRHKIALKYKFQNFKPVILFRSKLIEESKKDFETFNKLIKNLSMKDFDFLKSIKEDKTPDGENAYQKGKSRIIDIKHFILENDIDWSEVIGYLQYSFAERNCIITNSKSGTKTIEKTTDEQEMLLNSLEDKNNHIQAIFTVQRLTEGWDVLNLFDIVRLYEGQNEGGRNIKTSAATTAEVQLIGRGVRYYPFEFKDMALRKRKFDDDLEHELRVLEEFYYHSDDEHRYIAQLKNELKEKGYINEKRKIKYFALKKTFIKTDFYKSVKLFLNERLENPARRKLTLEEIKDGFEFSDSIPLISADETKIQLDKDEDVVRYATRKEDGQTFSFTLREISKNHKHIIRKAINILAKKDQSILRFENLQQELKIDSLENIFEDRFLGDMKLNIICPRSYKDMSDISNEALLNILVHCFEIIEKDLMKISNPHIGSAFKPEKFSVVFQGAREKLIEENEDNKILEKELVDKSWYVLDAFSGTSEERSLVNFLKETMGNLEKEYEHVFLLRNEEVFTIYDFNEGRGFQPDFLLFLKQKKKNLFYQVFIEPKGDLFVDAAGGFAEGKEGWKEKFLEDISSRYGENELLKVENKLYKLLGLPLYNDRRKEEFRDKYDKVLSIE